MAKTSVFEPLFDDGLASINFFNGRLLSAEDLTTERKAHREIHRRLGQAVGAGVIYGLDVLKSDASRVQSPTVTVKAGLAISRTGDPIRLEQDTEVSLRTAQAADGTPTVKVFTECDNRRGGTYVPSSGAYLLAITTVRGGKGLAPVSGLGNELAGCNTRYLVEGVEFELHEMALGSEAADAAHLRNRLAYACFGASELVEATAAPFGAGVGDYGRIGALRRAETLSPCAVPLAIVYWTGAGLQFVDQWAARRGTHPLEPASASWQMPVVCRRSAESEAMLFQFQEHLAGLSRDLANPRAAIATSHFRYLPPAGIVPLASTAYPFGFAYPKFFEGCYQREPVFIDAARVGPLLRLSWQYPPIDLDDRHMVWLYWVRENEQRVQQSTPAPPQKCLLFASGDVPFVGQARFDVSRWDFSNYSLVEGALD